MKTKAQARTTKPAAAVSQPAPMSPTAAAPRLAKDDFYEITAREAGGPQKLAVFNRRKDAALRYIQDAHKAGSDIGAAISKAYEIAFPRRPSTQQAPK